MNNSLFGNNNSGRNINDKRQTLEEMRAQLLSATKETSTPTFTPEEIGEYQEVASLENNKELEIGGPRLVKTMNQPRPNAFIDALVLGFLVAAAGLTSLLCMLLGINGALY